MFSQRLFSGFARHKWPILEAALGGLLFTGILSRFVFFMNSYGDAAGYLRYAGLQTFLFGGYQTTYPHFIYLVAHAFGSLDFIFFVQVLLYAATLILIRLNFRPAIGPVAVWVVCAFLLLNVRAYFYISNVLTETLNLFLYFLSFVGVLKACDLSQRPITARSRPFRVAILGFGCVVSLALLGLNRSSNLLFLVFLFLLFVLRLRVRSLVVIAGLALAIVAGYNLSLVNAPNNVGSNLFEFIYHACFVSGGEKSCPPEIFTGPATPRLAAWYTAGPTLGGIAAFVPDRFAPDFGRETETAYLRLVVQRPDTLAIGILKNWYRQVTSPEYAVYAEDPNLAALHRNPVLEGFGSVTTGISILVSIAAVFLIPYAVWRLFARPGSPHDQLVLAFLIAWILGELLASNFLAAQLYSPDKPRIRLHYETQSLLLALAILGPWLHRHPR